MHEQGKWSRGCALYMRLSREDGRDGESLSIDTQRKILREYAREHGFSVLEEYVDDGYSGTSLDRPAFNRMLRDIERGRIGTVVTKDVSRLGRNSGRVSLLLDEYFPQYRVRYISVGEQHDSARQTAADSVVMPMHNMINELYARDISVKIRAALDVKRRQGEYIGAFAPFGYRKDPENRNRLLVDEPAAEVVRRIFRLAKEGNSAAEIAKRLNGEAIPAPLRYRRGGSAGEVSGGWTGAGVSRLLRNETYLGHTVQGKSRRLSFKRKQSLSLPREEWAVVYHTHPPLVDGETWDVVRKRVGSRVPKREKGFVNLFSGLVRCADCGKCMSTTSTRRVGAQADLICGGYKLNGTSVCTGHRIAYDALYGAVLAFLRGQLRFVPEEKEQLLNRLLRACADSDSADVQQPQKQLAAVNGKLEQLFDDKYAGRITPETFEGLYRRYMGEREAWEGKCRAVWDAGQQPESRRERIQTLLEECTDLRTLTSELLFKLIERIDVHQGTREEGVKYQRIDLHLRFRCEPEEEGAACASK